MLWWMFAELLLFTNCWRANKIWSASIVAGVFSLRNCCWLVERFFFLLPWRCTRGAVCDFLVNSSHIVAITNLFCSSCHHVVAIPIRFCGSCHQVVAADSLSLSLNSCHHVAAIAKVFCNSCHHVAAIAKVFCNSCHHVLAVACLFVNSCHHVEAIFWARVLCYLAVEEARFRTRIILGVLLVRSLACVKRVPGWLRSGSGVSR